jgi:hypothetical protein
MGKSSYFAKKKEKKRCVFPQHLVISQVVKTRLKELQQVPGGFESLVSRWRSFKDDLAA